MNDKAIRSKLKLIRDFLDMGASEIDLYRQILELEAIVVETMPLADEEPMSKPDVGIDFKQVIDSWEKIDYEKYRIDPKYYHIKMKEPSNKEYYKFNYSNFFK